MLGHHPLLEHELRKKGRRAFAKVLDCRRTHYTETVGSAAVVGDTRILWSLVLEVEPDGEPPFEAKIDALLPQLWSPEPSAELAFPVLYDPEDHTKVVLDQSDEGYRALTEAQSRERVDAEVSRMRSRGQSAWADRYQAAMDSLAEYRRTEDPSANPDLQAQAWADEKAKMRSIMSGGTEQQVGGPASGAATAEALTKLANLRDRGALTEDEFQAQKKKLLGE
jgi:Short C-terminal domain